MLSHAALDRQVKTCDALDEQPAPVASAAVRARSVCRLGVIIESPVAEMAPLILLQWLAWHAGFTAAPKQPLPQSCDTGPMRELRWIQGRGWLSESPEKWPSSLRWGPVVQETLEHRFQASRAGAAGAALGPPIGRALLAGIDSESERPAGVLDLHWFMVHEIDFKLWAWSRGGAVVCRLLAADIAALSDEQACRVAGEAAAYRPHSIQ
jgi:hypothetical protein